MPQTFRCHLILTAGSTNDPVAMVLTPLSLQEWMTTTEAGDTPNRRLAEVAKRQQCARQQLISHWVASRGERNLEKNVPCCRSWFYKAGHSWCRVISCQNVKTNTNFTFCTYLLQTAAWYESSRAAQRPPPRQIIEKCHILLCWWIIKKLLDADDFHHLIQGC